MIYLVIGLTYKFRINEGRGEVNAKTGYGKYIGQYKGNAKEKVYHLFEVLEKNCNYGVSVDRLRPHIGIKMKGNPLIKLASKYYNNDIPLDAKFYSRRKTEILDYHYKRDKLKAIVINKYK